MASTTPPTPPGLRPAQANRATSCPRAWLRTPFRGGNQIRGVYSGEITDWSQLGVEDVGPIVAYQRPKNSGSQTALEALMGDTPLTEAPQGVVAWDMGDIVDTVEYRNLPNAIGYTFRFFCTDMMGSDVKLLAVDGLTIKPCIRPFEMLQ